MSDTTTKDHVHAELVSDEETALAPLQSGALEAPVLGPLAFQGDAVAVIKRMGETLQALQAALINTTQPEDWIVQGTGLALLGNAGCNRCAPLLGLTIEPLPGRDLTPVRVERENGAIEYTIAAWAYSRTLGRGEEIEVTRSSKEQFLGRQTDGSGNIVRKEGSAPHDPDHRSATRSLLLSKAVRTLGGLKNVPEARLLEIFGAGAKSRFQRGHGAGSGQDRTAAGATDAGSQERAQRIWDGFVRLHAGDVAAAKADLKKRTSYQEKPGQYAAFAGVDSLKQLATRNERTLSALERFLEKAAPEPPQEQPRERQPGEDE